MSLELPRLPKVPLDPHELGELAQLLFEWPIRRAPRLTLPLCILLATLVQTALVVIFSVSYEAPSGRLPVAPRFFFLPTDSAAARQLGEWLEANDPALFSPGRATATAVPPPPPLKYRPSYEEPPPPLHPLPREAETVIEPPMLPLSPTAPGSVTLGKTSPTAPALPVGVAPSPPTMAPAEWMDDLSGRLLAKDSGSTVPRLSAPKPSLYQVAVGPEGIPMHCVLTDSSGDAAADEAGRSWIMTRRFQPAGSTSWGRVLVPWENGRERAETADAAP